MNRRHIVRVTVAVSASLSLGVLGLVLPALAGELASQVISGSSPFAGCSNQGYATNHVNAEVEPTLAVNPSNTSDLAAAWQQDRWGDPSEGGAHGFVNWSSTDAGVTGTTSWAPFTTCSGGTSANDGAFDRASDVWLSYGPDGVLYQSALVFDETTGHGAITVSRSVDGGLTWSNPVVVDAQNEKSFIHGDDKESITADPYHPGYVYVVWDRYSGPNPSYSDGHGANSNRGPAYFARSTDGGRTWSPAKAIYSADNGTIGNQIVVMPNGTLKDFFVDYVVTNVKGGVVWTTDLMQLQSSDHGKTWSKTPTVVTQMTNVGAFDPVTLNYIRGGDGLFDVTVDPSTGRLYAVWQDNRFNGLDQVAFSMSSNGGATWSTPTRIDATPPSSNSLTEQAFTPTVAVNANGAVAVTYYNFQNYDGESSSLTDYWAIVSTDGGQTWGSSIRLTSASFNAQYAPATSGAMIGDYEALAASGNTFVAAFEVTNADWTNPTDIELARFTP